MGKFLKFLYGLMLVVLTILGAVFIAFGLGEESIIDYFLENVRDPFCLNIILGIGIALILFAVIILCVLIKNSNKGFDVIIEDDLGSVLITRNSLESVMERSINKFFAVKSVTNKAVIVENEKIEAKAVADYFGNDDIKDLSERMREEIVKNLESFTGISDIKLDLKLDKKEEERKDGKY